jgi:hypothetical protein
MIDGIEGHAINVESLDADIVFDPATQEARVVANLSFQVNAKGGAPLFDLRQTVSALTLDGEQSGVERIKTEDLGEPTGFLSVLDADLEPCSRHVLNFEYELATPDASESLAPQWQGEDAVFWDFALSDTEVGNFLELWLPSNLCHDEFSFALNVTVESDVDHTPISNAAVSVDAPNQWTLTFPDNGVSHTSMFVLAPTRDLSSRSSQLELPRSGTVELEFYKLNSSEADLEAVEEQLRLDMAHFEESTGDYMHHRFTAYVKDERGGMEYDGGTVSSVAAMSHETYHSWFARGVRPLTQNDGWIDEAWTMYFVDQGFGSGAREEESLDELMVWPTPLSSSDPWSRITPFHSYFVGAFVFRWFAASIGHEALIEAMAEFYVQHAPGPVTTADLERHLHCTTDATDVREVFHELVYVRTGELDPEPAGYCE